MAVTVLNDSPLLGIKRQRRRGDRRTPVKANGHRRRFGPGLSPPTLCGPPSARHISSASEDRQPQGSDMTFVDARFVGERDSIGG